MHRANTCSALLHSGSQQQIRRHTWADAAAHRLRKQPVAPASGTHLRPAAALASNPSPSSAGAVALAACLRCLVKAQNRATPTECLPTTCLTQLAGRRSPHNQYRPCARQPVAVASWRGSSCDFYDLTHTSPTTTHTYTYTMHATVQDICNVFQRQNRRARLGLRPRPVSL